MVCDDCGTSTGVRNYVNYTTKVRSKLCGPCCSIRNHPRNRIPEEWAAWQASRKKNAETFAPEAKPLPAVLDPNVIAAAAQRLVGEAARLEHPAPHPNSPLWVGRDLEVEGWERRVLVKAVQQAIDDGLLEMARYRDDWGNRKRELRAAADPFA